MRVVLAPDKFKGTLGARAAAQAMAKGVERVWPRAEVVLLPVADGGDGTAEVLLSAIGGEVEELEAAGPLGEPVVASLTHLADGRTVVEMAAASGLAASGVRNALRASSRGTGDLVRAALERSGGEVVVGIGGSASSDGGTGAATALGWRFLDAGGQRVSPGGGGLRDLSAISGDEVIPELGSRSVVGVSDVDNPLLGPRGAAAVFGPQKGASPSDVEALEAGLQRLSEVVSSDLGLEVASLERSGAGGGMGAGLVAFFGATLKPGFEAVAVAIGLTEALAGADIVVTGEGRLDAGSLGGKAPAGVARLAAEAGVVCVAIAGEVATSGEELQALGIAAAAGLVAEVGQGRALQDPSGALEEVTAALLSRLELQG